MALSAAAGPDGLSAVIQTLTRLVDEAEELEGRGQYRDAVEIVARALTYAHADYVASRYPGINLVRQPSSAMPRRSYVERYKARLRVDWQKWDRMSMRTVISAAVAAGEKNDDWADEDSESAPSTSARAESRASSILAPKRRKSIAAESIASFEADSSADGRDASSSIGADWQPETLEMMSEAGMVELVHKCGDGTKVKTSVRPFSLPDKVRFAFNRDPKKTMKGLLAGDESVVGVGGRAYSHEEIARWLLTAKDVSKNRIGDYLGRADEDAQKMLREFLAPLDLVDFTFDEALRFFLSLFRLPGEAQQIDRIMQNFAEKYYEARPDLFRVADTAYVLAFSLIMLNTDAHSDQIEQKMSLSQFLNNNRGIDEGGDLDPAMMTQLYHSIVKNEIRMEQREFITSVKEGWLLKQGGRIKTWRKRYTILSGNVLYYFDSPKDRAPAGFVPLEGIRCAALSDGITFEIRPIVHGQGIKSVKMSTGGGCIGGKKKGAFAHGNHSYFAFRTMDENDDVATWVQAVREHSVVDAVAQARVEASAKSSASGGADEVDGFGKATLSFFRSKAKQGVPKSPDASSTHGSSTVSTLPAIGE